MENPDILYGYSTLEVLPSDVEVTVQSPLYNERFVIGEEIEFSALITSNPSVDGSQLQWISSIDGDLGKGTDIQVDQLSAGTHEIEVTGYGESVSIQVRVFNDLWELYQSPPSQGEIDRIMEDFYIVWVDGDIEDEKWATYDPWLFEQSSTDPAKIVAIAKLDVLRHQRFSEPLPFTDGLTAYDHLKTYVHTIYLRLDCTYNSGGGGALYLNRSFSVWDARTSGTPSNWDACKTPFENPKLYTYINPLYLVMHECRHGEPDDPGHTVCESGVIGDQQLENGGGYAQSIMYLMWVYEYGLYDPQFIKEEAKNDTIWFLNRICNTPTHSNPLVQAILDELLP